MPASEAPIQMDLLLVDDDQDFRGMTARNFRKRGFHVEEAENGNAALQLAEQRAFDVAILDLSMPGMSGIELLEKLKEMGSDAEVVMLTGTATVKTAVEAMKLGAHDCLTKPAQMDELAVVVEKAYEPAPHAPLVSTVARCTVCCNDTISKSIDVAYRQRTSRHHPVTTIGASKPTRTPP
jgi:DNA-binding NtrC family response regulator